MKSAAYFLSLAVATSLGATGLPHLRQQGTATQLIVDGQPFLARGGELSNSHGEPEYLRTAWPTLPVLIASGFLGPQETEAIQGDRYVLAISKPFSMAEIKEKLASISAMRNSHSEWLAR